MGVGMIELPTGKPFDVVGVGVTVVNELLVVARFPEPDAKVDALAVARQGGGVVATAMVTGARLGLRTKYVGKVGADEPGAFARDGLQKEGVDLADVVVDPGEQTRRTVGLVEQGSGRRTLVRATQQPARLRPEEVPAAAIRAGRILHLDGYEGPAALHAARMAREAGVPVSLDAEDATEGCAALLPFVDVLIVSHPFAARLTGVVRVPAILEGLAGLGPRIVGVTQGAQGCAIRAGGRTVEAPGFSVATLDTTGAGDVFHGAFLAGLVWGWPLPAGLALANAVAALKCTRLGGQAGIPSLADARAFLTARGVALPAAPDGRAAPCR
jgi:sugar/nucleoside kinase (ribokinase family)